MAGKYMSLFRRRGSPSQSDLRLRTTPLGEQTVLETEDGKARAIIGTSSKVQFPRPEVEDALLESEEETSKSSVRSNPWLD